MAKGKEDKKLQIKRMDLKIQFCPLDVTKEGCKANRRSKGDTYDGDRIR